MQQNILELPVGSAPKNKSASGKKAVTAPQAAQTPTSPPAASPQPQKPTTQPPPADSAGGIYNPAANRFTASPSRRRGRIPFSTPARRRPGTDRKPHRPTLSTLMTTPPTRICTPR